MTRKREKLRKSQIIVMRLQRARYQLHRRWISLLRDKSGEQSLNEGEKIWKICQFVCRIRWKRIFEFLSVLFDVNIEEVFEMFTICFFRFVWMFVLESVWAIIYWNFCVLFQLFENSIEAFFHFSQIFIQFSPLNQRKSLLNLQILSINLHTTQFLSFPCRIKFLLYSKSKTARGCQAPKANKIITNWNASKSRR